jgi:hypothetical protein
MYISICSLSTFSIHKQELFIYFIIIIFFTVGLEGGKRMK